MKKYMLFLLTAWLVPWALAAQTTVASGTCGADGGNLTWVFTSDRVLTISGSGAMADYERYGSPWYDYALSYVSDKEVIKKIVVHEGVTSIGNYAFENCWNAESISLPGSVERIGSHAFDGCRLVEGLQLPSALRECGAYAFSGCFALKSIAVPGGVAALPESMFSGCSALAEVTLPDGLERIGKSAFSSCALVSVRIPESVVTIEDRAFNGCDALKAVEWDAVACLDFEKSILPVGIASVTFGEKVRRIPARLCAGTGITELAVPASVEEIGGEAFQNCTALAKVSLGSGVKRIGMRAFGRAGISEEVVLPDGLVEMDGYVFADCAKLPGVVWGKGLTAIPTYTFSGCSALAKMEIPDHVAAIEARAFSECTQLAELVVGKGVASIGGMAFYGCGNLSRVEWNAVDCADYSAGSFASSLSEVVFGNEVVYIPAAPFKNASITEVRIPESVERMGKRAFSGASALSRVEWGAVRCADFSAQPFPSTVASVSFGSKVAYIPAYLFQGTSVSEVLIPGSVEGVGAYAFSGCPNLARLQVGAGVAAVGEKAFSSANLAQVAWNAVDCADFNKDNVAFPPSGAAMAMTVGSGVRRIPAYFCYRCSGLSSLVFETPSSLQRVEEYAFYGCPLQDYELPGSVEYVGPYAFGEGDDSYLRELTITKALVDEGFTTDAARIDELVIADDVVALDLTRMFRNENLQIGSLKGNLPDTLWTRSVPSGEPTTHWMGRRATVYDMDHDGYMEYFSIDERPARYYTMLGIGGGSLDIGGNRNLSSYQNVDNDGVIDYAGEDALYRLVDGAMNLYAQFPDNIKGIADVDADGRADVLGQDGKLYHAQADGSYLPVEITLIDTAAVDSIVYQSAVAHRYVAATPLPSMKEIFAQMLAGYGGGGSAQEALTAIDVDRNGYTDLVSLDDGMAWLNYGDNRFYCGSIGGRILSIKDLTGDDIPDYVIYNEDSEQTILVSYNADGDITRQLLVSDLVVSNAWCYDFDGDGDADILLSFDYVETPGYAFLVFYRNDGNGSFRQVEHSFAEQLEFIDCVDVDNNGLYEVVAQQSTGNPNDAPTFRLIDCTASLDAALRPDGFTGGNPEYDYYGLTDGLFIGDLDGDGIIEYAGGSYVDNSSGAVTSKTAVVKFAGTPNTAPAKMERPSAIYEADTRMLSVSWPAGSDAESSSVDLTYALRVGTAPGLGDIVYAHATADGTRLNLRDGNMGHSLHYWMNVANWNPGTYYIAVQAIDPNHRGGAWSEELVYEHVSVGSGFTLDRNSMTTADTLAVAFHDLSSEGYTYDWAFGDSAAVVSEEGGCIRLVYHTPGDRCIELTVTDVQGRVSEATMKEVAVYAAGREQETLGIGNAPQAYADWDGDGDADITAYNGFYENEGKGAFNALGKIFNLNLTFNTQYNDVNVVDYDMDGLPDLAGTNNKGNLFLNGDGFNFTASEVSDETYFDRSRNSIKHLVDLDNDGLPDLYREGSSDEIFRNTGRMQFDVTTADRLGQDVSVYLSYDYLGACDIDRDGYTDLVGRVGERRDLNDPKDSVVVYKNLGNWTFLRIPVSLWVDNEHTALADMDNDGHADIVTLETTRMVRIHYGDADMAFSRNETVYLPIACENLSALHDVDNNGYPDVVLSHVVAYNYGNRFECQEVEEEGSSFRYTYNIMVDVDGDGVPDLARRESSTSADRYCRLASRIGNTAPQAPTNLRMRQTENGVVLEWDDAMDKETPKVQMRYNVSVKKKGATGAEAYLVSPMNGGRDAAAVVPGWPYVRSTSYVMPLSRFTPGEEYELRVQAIDLWNAVSAISEPFTFTVDESAAILFSADKVCVGDAVTARYVAAGASGAKPEWTAGDGEVTLNEDGTASILWPTSGVKTVTVAWNGSTVQASFYVRGDTVSLDMDLPERVLGGSTVAFRLPHVFADPSNKVWIDCDESEELVIARDGASLDAQAAFPMAAGTYTLAVHYVDAVCGERVAQYPVTVEEGIVPELSIVGVDEATGKVKLQWEVPESVLARTDLLDGIIVYKESGQTDNFVRLAELPLTATSYVDEASDPSVRKNRYRIALATTYGGESKPGAVHGSVHLMLNQGLNGAINMIWTPYEGGVVDQYTIWRGTSADDMQILTTASGYEMSYTDQTAGSGEYVYALSYENVAETGWASSSSWDAPIRAPQAGEAVSARSNAVSTAQAIRTVFVNDLNIRVLEGTDVLSVRQPALHLYAELLPANATIRQVAWSILSGSDLATVTSSGELVAADTDKEGRIVVQAAAIDGSGLKAELTIQKIDLRPASISIALPDGVEALAPSVPSIQLQAIVYPEGASQEVVWSLDEGESLASISADGMLRAVGEDNGIVVVRATSAEDASVSATIEIEKKDFDGSGIEETEAGIALRAWMDGDDLVVDGLPSGVDARLQVVSADGRVLLDAESRGEVTLRMDVRHLSPGFYLLQAGSGMRQAVFRFIRR